MLPRETIQRDYLRGFNASHIAEKHNLDELVVNRIIGDYEDSVLSIRIFVDNHSASTSWINTVAP